MGHYKEILLFCSEHVHKLITSTIFYPGIRFLYTSNVHFFNAILKDSSPDAVILSARLAHKDLIDCIGDVTSKVPTAVVVEDDETEFVLDLLSTGATRFIKAENLKSHLSKFIDTIIASSKRQKTLVQMMGRMRNLAEYAEDGIIILDDLRVISYSNRAASEILGMSTGKLNGSPFTSIFSDISFDEDDDRGKSFLIEDYIFTDDNEGKHQIDIKLSLIYENRRFTGAVVIFNKVSTAHMDRKQELELLKYQQMYHSTQQNMAFKKQMLVLKDDMSNIKTGELKVETYFKPLDILSGDIYGSVKVGSGIYLFYIIDAMGKGLSASITALQSSSFINHSLEFSLFKNDFDLERTISSFINYIKDRLMDEEALCCVFTLLDTDNETMTVANYGMPPIYMLDSSDEIQEHKPNNLPIMKYYSEMNTRTIDLKDVNKILVMSDGLLESETTEGGLYAEYMCDHFRMAITKKHFMSLVNKQIKANDDDLTFFFIKRDLSKQIKGTEYEINSSNREVSALIDKLGNRMEADGVSETDKSTIEYAITEIMINAMEHGNLGIGCDEKQNYIAKGVYDDIIAERTKEGTEYWNKKIKVIYKFLPPEGENLGQVIISIKDEGKGFAASNLFKYHSFDGNLCHVDKDSYNGRGIFISDSLLDGLYYNIKGNSATLLKLIDPEED